MGVSYQKLILMGNLSADPDVKTTSGGAVVARFAIAHNYKKKEEEHVTWFNCVAFNKTAEFVEKFFSKGKPAMIEGRVELDTWEAKDGTKRTSLNVLVDRVGFVPGDYSENEDTGDETGGDTAPRQTERGRQASTKPATSASDKPAW